MYRTCSILALAFAIHCTNPKPSEIDRGEFTVFGYLCIDHANDIYSDGYFCGTLFSQTPIGASVVEFGNETLHLPSMALSTSYVCENFNFSTNPFKDSISISVRTDESVLSGRIKVPGPVTFLNELSISASTEETITLTWNSCGEYYLLAITTDYPDSSETEGFFTYDTTVRVDLSSAATAWSKTIIVIPGTGPGKTGLKNLSGNGVGQINILNRKGGMFGAQTKIYIIDPLLPGELARKKPLESTDGAFINDVISELLRDASH